MILSVPFEQFTKQAAAEAGPPMVTIQRRGIFALNEAAFQTLGKPDAVLFFYDPDRKVVGLQAAGVGAEDSYRVRSTKNHGGTRIVTGSLFTRHYDIPTDHGRRFPAAMEGDILAFDISGRSTSYVISDEDPEEEAED